MIPFKYGTVVWKDDFCGRNEQIKQLKNFILSSQNVLIYGERRIGKTSLIYETIRRTKNYSPIIIDLMEIKSVYDFCKRMINAILTAQSEAIYITKSIDFLKSLRPKIGFDPVTNLPTVSLDPSQKIYPESIEQLFDLIKEFNKNKKGVIVFDEFQGVLKLENSNEVIAIIRSKIQYHKDIPYIFAGSIRSQMDELFINNDSPLFKSAIPINIGPIDQGKFKEFIIIKFAIGKRKIDDETLEIIFKTTDSVTGDIQQFCEALWSVTSYKDIIKKENIADAIKLIFAREEDSYEFILNSLTAIQQRCLVGLAKSGGENPTSSAFLTETGIKQPATVTRSLEKLIKSRIIFKYKGKFRFVNAFFREWLIYRNI